MSEWISREEVLQQIDDWLDKREYYYSNAIDYLKRRINSIETKAAVWKDKSCWEFGEKFKQCIYQCSNCGYEVRHDPFSRGDGRGGKYCDDCGARMSKE